MTKLISNFAGRAFNALVIFSAITCLTVTMAGETFDGFEGGIIIIANLA